MSIFELLNRDEEPEKPEKAEEPEELVEQEPLEEPEAPPPPVRKTRKVVHRARAITPAAPVEEEHPPEGDGGGGKVMGSGQRTGRFRSRLEQRRSAIAAARSQQQEAEPAQVAAPEPEPEAAKSKFTALTDAVKKGGKAVLPRKYLLRPALWDFSSIFSLVMNAILLGVVILLAFKINTLQKTLNGLLGGLYDNFVRMDRSYITTTIQVNDMPIPLDFILPVVQSQTNVTLTQEVTIRNAHVVITTDEIRINAPATVTLPVGTTLPVSLQMDVPVQTTVLVDLMVPVNIELASAYSSDPAIANLHTAFLGLQDTIGPLYCLLEPAAVDYLTQPLCNSEGIHLSRNPTNP